MGHWGWPRIALATVLVAALAFGALLLYQCGYALLVAFVAPLLATPLLPAVRVVERLGASRALAAVVVHMTVAVTVAACIVALLPLSWQQATELIESLPAQYERLYQSIVEADSEAVRGLAAWLPEELPSDVQPTAAGTAITLDEAWYTAASISWNTFFLIACVLASIYWSVERLRLIHGVKLLLPAERRPAADELFVEVEHKLGAFVRGQAMLCVLVGLMAWAAYWWIGLPYAAILALLAGICEAVPVIGPIVGTLPAILVAFGIGPSAALWAVVANIFIASIESYVLVPRIMNRAVGVHPIVTLLAISALFALLGPIGGVLAVPLAAMTQLAFKRWIFPPASSIDGLQSAERGRVGVLQYRARELLDELHARMSRSHPAASTAQQERFEEDMELVLRRLIELLRRARVEEPQR